MRFPFRLSAVLYGEEGKTMSKIKKYENDVIECGQKIFDLLREYRCQIEFDEEIKDVIIVDVDTKEFGYIHKIAV